MKIGTSRRSIEFTVEKTATYSISRKRLSVTAGCAECGADAGMCSPEDAAEIVRTTKRKIYAWIEDGKTHFVESPDGSVMVCLRSIEQNANGRLIGEGGSDRS